MGALESYTQSQWLKSDSRQGYDLPDRFKGDDVKNRPGSRGATKWTVFEMGVSAPVVQMMRGHRRRDSCGTDLQLKRPAARRHEAEGNVGPKQEHRQQQAGR